MCNDNEILAHLEGARGAHGAAVPNELAIVGQVEGLAFVRDRDSNVGVEC